MKPTLLPTYDFDGNVLSPQTASFFVDMQTNKIVEVPAHEVDQNPSIYFDKTKYMYPEDNAENAFQRFSDYYPHDKHPGPDWLINDTKDAIKESLFAPSFPSFKKLALIEANLFAILTARGHGSDNIQRTIELLSRETLTDDEKKDQKEHIKEKYTPLIKQHNILDKDLVEWFFADIPSYMGVSNKNFCKLQDINRYENTAYKKVLGIQKHYQRATSLYKAMNPTRRTIQFAKGFSDDSIANIEAMAKYYLQEVQRNKDRYRIYFTGKLDQRKNVQSIIKSMPWWENTTFQNTHDIMKISIHKW